MAVLALKYQTEFGDYLTSGECYANSSNCWGSFYAVHSVNILLSSSVLTY